MAKFPLTAEELAEIERRATALMFTTGWSIETTTATFTLDMLLNALPEDMGNRMRMRRG